MYTRLWLPWGNKVIKMPVAVINKKASDAGNKQDKAEKGDWPNKDFIQEQVFALISFQPKRDTGRFVNFCNL